MNPIITDQSALRQISKPVVIKKYAQDHSDIDCISDADLGVVNSLIESIPDNGAGLAAPQINQFKRIFLARLASGTFVFVNPSLSDASPDMVPSEEGCLSIPDVTWCVNRHNLITVNADIVFQIIDGMPNKIQNTEMKVKRGEAFIVQHEVDHLEGVLMIDHTPVKTVQSKILARNEKRKEKLISRRADKILKKRQTKRAGHKISPKRADRIKGFRQADQRRTKKRVEIQERLRAQQEHLFDDAAKEG